MGNSILLKEWSGIQKPVFFDFGKPLLWAISDGWVFEFDKYDFIEGVKMSDTLTILLKEKVKNLYEERKSTEALERKRGKRSCINRFNLSF